MDLAQILSALLGGALAGAGVGALVAWAGVRWHVSNSFATEREQVRAVLARARIDLEEAGQELEKWSARGARERARVEQAERRGKAPNGEIAASPSFSGAGDYKRHLQRGGARDREYEKTLWANSHG